MNIGKISDKKLSEKMNKSFNITAVCREDLTRFMSKKKAVNVSDEDMEHIATKMADGFCNCCYWELLENAYEQL